MAEHFTPPPAALLETFLQKPGGVDRATILPPESSDLRTASDVDHSAMPVAGHFIGTESPVQTSQSSDSGLSSQGFAATPSVCWRHVDPSARILVAAADPECLKSIRRILFSVGYRHISVASNARQVLPTLRSESPDVLLLDLNMPEISGLDILRVAGLDTALQHIPVLLLSEDNTASVRRHALELGASDFLSKPIDPDELLARVRNSLVVRRHYQMEVEQAIRLQAEFQVRSREMEFTRNQLILCLARAAEHRDSETGNHVIRVGRYTAIIARQMGYPEQHLEMLEQAAQLHDVGKIGIPDSILFKPARLAKDEYELMKKHCALGRQIIEPISDRDWDVLKSHTRLGGSMLQVRTSPLLMLAARIAQSHHERWDGSGYPLGLAGEDIPLEGRIVAVADVFDALSSRRPYKDPYPRQRCFEILRAGRGVLYDPTIIDAFFACSREIIEVQLSLMDAEDCVPRDLPESGQHE